jgi:transposase InsO family protein
MPWREATMQEQREEFVRLASAEGANVSELCRRHQISRKTGYKWLQRHGEGASLQDAPRRPYHSPTATPAPMQQRVVRVRLEHPAWGARKIAHVLLRDEGIALAVSTVNSILQRQGLIGEAASQASRPWQRFEHEQPNALWQMDFKGHFPVGDARCHALTVLDDHSRYALVLQALADEQRASVQTQLTRAFERYGLPERINADNGPPWGTGCQGISALHVWLASLEVRLSHSRPAHPQTNGKDERFHRTLKAESIASRSFRDLDQVQAEFTRWRHIYNHERPHEALGMCTPVERYRPSPRAMPAQPLQPQYERHDLVRRVQHGGWVSVLGRAVRLSSALHGRSVALRARADQDGVYDVFFYKQKVDSIDLTAFD